MTPSAGGIAQSHADFFVNGTALFVVPSLSLVMSFQPPETAARLDDLTLP